MGIASDGNQVSPLNHHKAKGKIFFLTHTRSWQGKDRQRRACPKVTRVILNPADEHMQRQ